MHMADALLSPQVGVSMIVATASVAAYSIKKINNSEDYQKKIPLMGALGAFVFASQMINFSIPATGSSGHLGGGMLLAILLDGPASFLVMASILILQALFFADGGLLALGANIFNLGFYSSFIAYPLIYKKIVGEKFSEKRIISASFLSAIVALQLGAFSVVIETLLSGKTEINFLTFLALMQPIHLAIGIIEGAITATVVLFIWKNEPSILNSRVENGKRYKAVLIGIVIASLIVGGVVSWFASSHPDGLEWSILKTTGKEALEADSAVHKHLSTVQDKIALMPDYNFKLNEADDSTSNWPNISSGTTVAGIVGSITIFILIIALLSVIMIFKRLRRGNN